MQTTGVFARALSAFDAAGVLLQNETTGPGDRVGGYLRSAGEYLTSVTTAEERVALSLALTLGAVALGWYLLPRVTASLDRPVTDRFVTGHLERGLELFGHYVPTTFGGIVVRVVQLSLLVFVAVAVLVLWGFSDVVFWAARTTRNQAPLVGKVTSSLVVALLAYICTGLLRDTIDDFSTETEWMTEHQEEIVLRVSQLGLFVVAGLVLMSVWGATIEGFLVGAGFLGIVVGFAARQTFGSLIAGFVLMFSRPFTIGDWVQVGDQEGIVTDITIFNTRLENFDGEFVVIPNDKVANQAITNRSQKGLLRIRLDVGIDYTADPHRAREVAQNTIVELADVVDAPPPQVFPKAFGDSAVVLEMRFWIDHPTPPRKWKAISAVVSSVKEAFEAEDIKIPYPQRELSGRAETGGFRVHGGGMETREATPEPPDTD
ncbi:mechanosensitive ion channel protein [Halobacteriales archaeon QS_4_69_31]|nr:MAG: mechanosensitive ion channel protein [Halobacteriales archaeon QS_4_69_31]